ncbi:MAG: hypothetical protein GY820_30445 [Gammaproteobacteria bacterium]|nr:hypothetical protein [Gammaproteobacteria bacterium]
MPEITTQPNPIAKCWHGGKLTGAGAGAGAGRPLLKYKMDFRRVLVTVSGKFKTTEMSEEKYKFFKSNNSGQNANFSTRFVALERENLRASLEGHNAGTNKFFRRASAEGTELRVLPAIIKYRRARIKLWYEKYTTLTKL